MNRICLACIYLCVEDSLSFVFFGFLFVSNIRKSPNFDDFYMIVMGGLNLNLSRIVARKKFKSKFTVNFVDLISS